MRKLNKKPDGGKPKPREVKSDGSYLGKIGARFINAVQSEEGVEDINKFKRVGKDIYGILDPTGISNWQDAQEVWSKDIPLAQKLLTTAGAIPITGKGFKMMKALGKSEIGWKAAQLAFEKGQDVNNLISDLTPEEVAQIPKGFKIPVNSLTGYKAEGGDIEDPLNVFNKNTDKTFSTIPSPFNRPGIKTAINDNRKKSATTNKAINPNKDLVSGKYDTDKLAKIIQYAKTYDIDPYTLLSMDLQETGFGTNKIDGSKYNPGHVMMASDEIDTPNKVNLNNFEGGIEYWDNAGANDLARAYVSKVNSAKRQGLKQEADIIQSFNGRGKVFPSTEAGYHGFNMKSAYGVPIPNEGIDMKKNPLYGKRIMDIRDNVLKNNQSVRNLVDSVQPLNPNQKKDVGGTINTANRYINGVATAGLDYYNNPYSFDNFLTLANGAANLLGQNSQDKSNQNFMMDQQNSNAQFITKPGNISGSRGDYMVSGSGYGQFRPDETGVKSPYGMYNGMYYPNKAIGGGIIADEVSAPNEFMGNSSIREFAGYIPEVPAFNPVSKGVNYDVDYSKRPVTINDNTKKAYEYYTKEKNLPSHIAAGIVGNLFQESGLKPGAVEQEHTGNGRGIAQWDIRDRWQGYLSWAQKQGKNPTDVKSQLDYVLVEPGESSNALKRLKNTSTPEEAAVIFGKLYERPSNKYASWSTRTSVAAKLASGNYEEGGEYDMTDSELKSFMEAGGEVDFI